MCVGLSGCVHNNKAANIQKELNSRINIFFIILITNSHILFPFCIYTHIKNKEKV